MDASIVLNQYQELCNTCTGFFQYHTSANTTLEWFGRTIRGRQKIQHFIRNEISLQYVHDFQTALECAPIETKPSHMQTKELNDDELLTQNNSVPTNHITTDILTPPQEKSTPQLPKLTQGRSFISTSDDELISDLNMRKVVTPPPKKSHNLNFNEPSKKRYRLSDPDSGSCSPLPNVNEYFRKKSTNSRNGCSRSRCTGTRNITETSNAINMPSTTVGDGSNNYGYSQLMYLESRGIIRNVNIPKHRGVSGNDYLTEVPRTSSWERETKIKLSYRIRLKDNYIQYFLIIYEHLGRMPTSKRNLLLEFKESDPKDENEKKPSNKRLLQQQDIKRNTTLKKNLRFF